MLCALSVQANQLLTVAVKACDMPPGAVSLYSFRYAFYNYMCAGGAKNAARRGMGHNDSSRSGEGFYANTLMGFSSSMLYRGDKRVQVFNPGMCVALRAGERDAPVSSRVDVAGAVEEDAECQEILLRETYRNP